MMEKYFCNYNQSLALKELGFNDPCLSEYWKRDDGEIFSMSGNELFELKYQKEKTSNVDDMSFIINRPLKSQVFEWFRNEHGLNHMIDINFRTNNYITQLWRNRECLFNEHSIKTYEEAESACIDKLIEIVKNK